MRTETGYPVPRMADVLMIRRIMVTFRIKRLNWDGWGGAHEAVEVDIGFSETRQEMSSDPPPR